MRNVLLQAAMKLNRNRKRRKSWQKVVRALIMVVVFCTTYALILPAITMQAEPVCGMEAHTHTEECYTLHTAVELACTAGSEGKWIHQHGDHCWDASENLICLLPEIREHTHNDDCYTQTRTLNCPVAHVHSEACAVEASVLSCGLEEAPAHSHSESCGSVQSSLICTIQEEGHSHEEGCYELKTIPCQLPETEGHAHTESCYTVQLVPCDQPTAEDHAHEEACYQTSRELTCGLEELQAHTHDESCRDAEGNLVCTLPEIPVHTHTEECLKEQERKVLHCTVPEHSHEDACYPLEEETPVTGLEFRCGFAKHIHGETCYAADGQQTCTIPEHTHEAACVVEDLDLTADVETEEDWKKSVSGMTRTGSWPADVLAVAETQLGYRESVKNVILAGDVLKGYTRYGAWHEEPYADWNILFAAFCLDQAAVKDFPVQTDAARWVEALTENQLYRTPDAYTPKAGDLIFIDLDQTGDSEKLADMVGIVAELLEATEETPAQVRLIAGDQKDQVSYVTYALAAPAIVGYGDLPEGCHIKTHAGEDYTVTVTYTDDAAIPENAELAVREILDGTEEYERYYNQSLEALMKETPAEAQPEISFARFFDIHFLVNGEILEPAAPVDIQIVYSDAIAVKEEEQGQAIHFAQDGVELLHASTSLTEPAQEAESGILAKVAELFTGETEQVDTFRFTQESFSVTGTLVASRAAANVGTQVKFADIDKTGSTQYVLYTEGTDRENAGKFYALSGTANDNKAVEITVDANTVTLPEESANLLWTFQGDLIQNVGTDRYLHPYSNDSGKNITTEGAWDVQLVQVTDASVKVSANGYYVRVHGRDMKAEPNNRENDATVFYIAAVGAGAPSGVTRHVWLDGTHNGIMAYNGSDNTHYAVESGETFTLPETWKSPNKYAYVLKGWYNIKDNTYYEPGEEVTITADAVFYADWVAASYDIGQLNGDVLPSLDTSEFVTTDLFDYNPLFNVQSVSHTGSVSATGHSETWTLAQSGRVPYQNMESLNFIFRDWDSGGKHISYPGNLNTANDNQGTVTSNILGGIGSAPGRVLEALFGSGDVIGKTYVGSGNYLFQYMDETTPNYDNEHNGYYYYDSKLNAASYNQSQNRFYVYDYLERTSDSEKDGGEGEFSDFLPFNSPYVNTNGMRVETYDGGNYQYDAKVNNQGSEAGNAGTNYHFGMRTNIHFYLPNNSGVEDDYGNFGNLSTSGDPMIFKFRGDDDLWVFLDGKLVRDVGGVHGVKEGTINFSSGEIHVEGQLKATVQFTEGAHNLTIYYLERGSSQSNCAIYFNLAPRYSMEMEKRDYHTGEALADGVEFTVYTDEACTKPAQLWDTHDDAKANKPSKSTFQVKNGIVKFFGLVAGKTYYIKETTTPVGYLQTDDIIRVALSSRGISTNDATIMRGPNGDREDGFEIISNSLDEETQLVDLVLTNQKANSDTMQLRVRKRWADGSVNIPDSISVYLRINGVRSEIPVTLNAENGWTYTWTGLPVKDENGRDIQYSVEETDVPGYISEIVDVTPENAAETFTEWLNVRSLDDGETYLLTYSGYALAATENGGFRWVDLESAKNDSMALWVPNAGGSTGFVLTNRAGYSIALNGTGGFIATTESDVNSILYYDSTSGNLYALNSNVAYRMGDLNAAGYSTASTNAGIALDLLREDTYLGIILYHEIINTPIPEEEQTFLQVEKVWNTVYDTTNYNVTIHLLADGADTGRSLVLNRRNEWKGTFEGLPLYREDGKTRIQYTVEEDEISGYIPTYSDVTVVEGGTYDVWEVSSSLGNNETYQIVYGNSALASNSSNAVVLANRNSQDTYQQWKVVNGRLQNVATGRYLRYNNGLSMSTTTGSNVTLSNSGTLKVGDRYLRVSNNSLSTTNRANDATQFLVYRKTSQTSPDGYAVTVTNTRGAYKLPETGGMGTSYFTFGGLLMIAAACVYLVIQKERKYRRGGTHRRS